MHIFHYQDSAFCGHTIYNNHTSKVETAQVSLPEIVQEFEFAEGDKMAFIQSQNKCVFVGGDLEQHILTYDMTNYDWNVMKDLKVSEELEWLGGNQGLLMTNDDRYMVILNAFESWGSEADSDQKVDNLPKIVLSRLSFLSLSQVCLIC